MEQETNFKLLKGHLQDSDGYMVESVRAFSSPKLQVYIPNKDCEHACERQIAGSSGNITSCLEIKKLPSS